MLTTGAWSALDNVNSVTSTNEMGQDVEVGHQVWVEGPVGGGAPTGVDKPLTVSGTYGCGKMLYSVYHTGDDTHTGLSPQELILLYLIIEIGVCAENPVPPPPIP